MSIAKPQYHLLLLLALIVTFSFSCKKDKSGTGSKTSAYDDESSHDVGAPCLNCHNSGGSNTFWWTIGGTVYKPDTTLLAINSTVYLYTGKNGTGTMNLLLPVDAKGNFYTSSTFNFGTGLYPQVQSLSGEIRYMQSSTTNGNCNSCHGPGNRIIVN